MRLLARLSLATLGMALAVPMTARADDAPLSRSSAASPAPHVHKHSLLSGKAHLCEKCAAAKAAREAKATKVASKPSTDMAKVTTAAIPAGMEGANVVSCVHKKDGVCKECKTFLDMPGKVSVVGSDHPFPRTDGAPGRAVASDKAPGRAVVSAGEPEPIGVMRTNYTASAPAAGAVAAPGRATVQNGSVGHTPFMSPTPESTPHILGHLFGFAEIRNDFQDWRESRGKRKRDSHAAIPYGIDGSKVEELPASMVYGKDAR